MHAWSALVAFTLGSPAFAEDDWSDPTEEEAPPPAAPVPEGPPPPPQAGGEPPAVAGPGPLDPEVVDSLANFDHRLFELERFQREHQRLHRRVDSSALGVGLVLSVTGGAITYLGVRDGKTVVAMTGGAALGAGLSGVFFSGYFK